MGLNNLLAVFLPKDKVFYTLFEKVAITVVEMGRVAGMTPVGTLVSTFASVWKCTMKGEVQSVK